MRLFQNLRSAEQKSAEMMRHGIARAREEWEDVERRIRQRMRIYPQKLKNKAVMAAAQRPIEADIPVQEPLAEREVSRPIVSVHGHDVKGEELDKPAA